MLMQLTLASWMLCEQMIVSSFSVKMWLKLGVALK
jgi:hypothetical protein